MKKPLTNLKIWIIILKSDKGVSDENKVELFVLTVSQGCIRSIP